MDTNAILSMMSNPWTREVFRTVAKNRYVRFRDLCDRKIVPDPKALNSVLQDLTNAALIRTEEAPVADFNTYYVTAEGLSAERALTRFEGQLRAVSSSR